MSAHRLTVVMACCCEQLFDLAADIERYPDFLPGWQAVRVIGRSEGQMRVEQRLGLPLIGQRFVSTARLERPDRVHIQASDGPFRKLQIEWRFERLGQDQCRITLRLEYQLTSQALNLLADQLFRIAAEDVIGHFVSRAQTLYGCHAITG